MTTQPLGDRQNAPYLMVPPSFTAPDGSVFVHKDLVRISDAWETESHIPPIITTEKFGDVESWVEYVKKFSPDDSGAHLTWNSSGLRAVLDYHKPDDYPGRCKWLAECPFVPSVEWAAWTRIATGEGIPHRKAVELLEDRGLDIQKPDAAALMALLRSLRASVAATAQTELRPDGTTSVAFSQDKMVRGGGDGKVELPPVITIAIPVLKGHGVLYQMDVRLRAFVDDASHLSLRFSLPTAERVLEEVYAEKVAEAKGLLGDAFKLLRAAG